MGTKTRAMMERVGLAASPFENPEVAAMELIAEILRKLPDDDARLRVMRWSFGRFNPEFKRPLPDATTSEPAAAPQTVQLLAAPPQPATPQAVTPQTSTPQASTPQASTPQAALPATPEPVEPLAAIAADMTSEIAAVAPEMATPPPPRRVVDITDFGSQLSELSDLFLPDPRRRSAATDGPPINLDAF